MAKLLSGKVGVQTYAGLSTSRNQIVGGQPTFLGLSEVEPNLGLSPNNNYVLYGDANGTRRWGEPSGSPSGTVSGITIRDEGLNPVGLAGSITIIDIVGDGIVAIQTHISQGGVQVGLATLTVPANNLDGQSGSGFVEVTGISTLRVGAGLTIFAPSGTTGIASIGNITDANIDLYDSSSYLTVPAAAQIVAGVGLTLSSPSANRGRFDVTGNIPRLNVSGITTLTQIGATDLNASGIITATTFDGNLTGNVTGNVTGDVSGNITGNTTGNLTGDVYAGLATATKGFTGNINSSGVSTVTQLSGTTIAITGLSTARGYVSNINSFMGNVNASGISTVRYLQNTNIITSGVTTSSSFVGDLTGNVIGNVTGNVSSTGSNTVGQLTVTGVTTSSSFVGPLTGNVTGNVTGNLTGNVTGNITSTGLSKFTNRLILESSDGNPARLDFYCEVSNLHYTRLKAAPHSEYSGSPDVILPTKAGDLIVGDTVGAISQNIHTSGIITATKFVGDGVDLTNVSAGTVLVTATNTTDATHYMTFSDSVSGQETMRTDTSLTYNPNSNTLSSTNFSGTLSGTATGLAGTPAITVGNVTSYNILPAAHNTYSLGSDAVRFANIYSADLHLSNKDATANSVDGTFGDWTLQEGENDIYMINNLTGKKYKINLTEV